MIAKKLKSSRKFRVFLIALLLSAFLWFINHLTNDFHVNVSIDVHIKNIPAYYQSNQFPDTTLQLEITGSGFGLIRYYLKDKLPIELDFSSFTKKDAEDKHIFALPKADLMTHLQREFPGNLQITEFDYEELSYSITSYPKKKIAVFPTLNYSCANGYMVLGQIKIIPDSVELEGPSKIIGVYDSLFTNLITLNNLTDSVNINAQLSILESDAWMFSSTSVDIQSPETQVKRIKWNEQFQVEIEGKVIKEDLVFEAWVPVYLNKVKTKIKHKIKDREIIITPQIISPARLISFSPSIIPLE